MFVCIAYIVCTYLYSKAATHCILFIYVCIYLSSYVCTLVPLFYNGFKDPWAYLKPQKYISSNIFPQPSILSKMLFRKHLKFNTPLSLLNDDGNLQQ